MLFPRNLQFLVSLCVLCNIKPAFGALYDGISSLPQDKQYDYVIVGGQWFYTFFLYMAV
jgi:hypothetical protein